MKLTEINAKLKQIIDEQTHLEFPLSELSDNERLLGGERVSLDSADILALILKIEEAFPFNQGTVRITATDLSTLGTLSRYVQKRLADGEV